MPRVKYLDTVRGVEIPRIVARSDNTYAPQQRIYNRRNAQYDLSSWNAESPKQRTKINHQKDEYNKRERRNRQVTTKGREHTKAVKAKHNIEDAQDKKYQAVIEDLSTDTPYWLLNQKPDQLWDKDAVDRAKNQREWLGNSFWTTGSGWQARANNLDPYTQRELINEDFQRASFLPRLVGETATTLVPLGVAPGKFVKGAAAGYLGGKLNDVAINAFTPYSSWNDMANKRWGWNETEGMLTNPGGWLGGFGYGRLSKAWNNPNSLLSRNIRTAFANDKAPYDYIISDPQNILPYIKGAYNTIKGKEIPLKPFSIPYNMEDVGLNLNRYKAWRKYLGVGNDEENLRMVSGINTPNRGKYIKQKDGTYDYTFTPDEEVMLLPTDALNNEYRFSKKNDGSFLTSDFVIGNHGNVGGKLKYNDNGKVVAIIEDPWDLNPFRKYIPKKLRPYLDLEMSKFLPAGAKPFTLKHTIPITDHIIGIDTRNPTIGTPSPTFDLNTIEDVIKASRIGGFVRKK